MTRYRCKHAVEAMRWTDESHVEFCRWHDEHANKMAFVQNTHGGPGLVVRLGDEWSVMRLGEWLVYRDGEFLVMDDEQFRETYEEG